jgi:hypothetical protein
MMNITEIIATIAAADWHTAAIAGALHFVFVFFKAFQQRNVAFMHYWWIMPISFCMSTTEVFALSLVAISAVAADHWWQMLPYACTLGVGGGSGAIVAMYTHHRYVK